MTRFSAKLFESRLVATIDDVAETNEVRADDVYGDPVYEVEWFADTKLIARGFFHRDDGNDSDPIMPGAGIMLRADMAELAALAGKPSAGEEP
jgi:hypothetical protein